MITVSQLASHVWGARLLWVVLHLKFVVFDYPWLPLLSQLPTTYITSPPRNNCSKMSPLVWSYNYKNLSKMSTVRSKVSQGIAAQTLRVIYIMFSLVVGHWVKTVLFYVSQKKSGDIISGDLGGISAWLLLVRSTCHQDVHLLLSNYELSFLFQHLHSFMTPYILNIFPNNSFSFR